MTNVDEMVGEVEKKSFVRINDWLTNVNFAYAEDDISLAFRLSI